MRPELRSFIAIRAAEELGSHMVNVAIEWYVYAATGSPMSLAYAGLAQFLPNFGLVLIAGQASDRFDRRKVLGVSLFVQMLCLAVFTAFALKKAPSVGSVYVLLLVLGSARAFVFPAMSALLPQVVNGEEFPRAVAATASQICTIVGPAAGGLLYAVSGPAVFGVTAGLYLFAMAKTLQLEVRDRPVSALEKSAADTSVLGGIRYVWANRLLLALISLDLFAVLLGGVTRLLPIYAKDILAVGPAGLGWLRCAPGVGAAVVGFVLARRTIERGAGKLMLACVAGFGLANVVFAISRNFWLSLAALTAAGGFDMVSMVIRQTLVQISTPDAARGRVSAVGGVFISASNELGEFESGATAAWLGTVPAALLGGLGTLAVVGLWSRIFPEVSRAERLTTGEPESARVASR